MYCLNISISCDLCDDDIYYVILGSVSFSDYYCKVVKISLSLYCFTILILRICVIRGFSFLFFVFICYVSEFLSQEHRP